MMCECDVVPVCSVDLLISGAQCARLQARPTTVAAHAPPAAQIRAGHALASPGAGVRRSQHSGLRRQADVHSGEL